MLTKKKAKQNISYAFDSNDSIENTFSKIKKKNTTQYTIISHTHIVHSWKTEVYVKVIACVIAISYWNISRKCFVLNFPLKMAIDQLTIFISLSLFYFSLFRYTDGTNWEIRIKANNETLLKFCVFIQIKQRKRKKNAEKFINSLQQQYFLRIGNWRKFAHLSTEDKHTKKKHRKKNQLKNHLRQLKPRRANKRCVLRAQNEKVLMRKL